MVQVIINLEQVYTLSEMGKRCVSSKPGPVHTINYIELIALPASVVMKHVSTKQVLPPLGYGLWS